MTADRCKVIEINIINCNCTLNTGHHGINTKKKKNEKKMKRKNC